MKLKDTLPKARKINLVHPVLGETGAWIKIVGTESNEYIKAVEKILESRESNDKQSKMDEAAFLVSEIVVGWDEEFFDTPYSKEAAKELFKDHSTKWVKDIIEEEAGKREAFFDLG